MFSEKSCPVVTVSGNVNARITLECKEGIPARVVVIQLLQENKQVLSLCEVEVYGSKHEHIPGKEILYKSACVRIFHRFCENPGSSLPALVTCPKDYEAIGDSCYQYQEEPSPWEAALKFCRDQGTELATIYSGRQSASAYLVAHNHNSSYWIGMSRNVVSGKGTSWH